MARITSREAFDMRTFTFEAAAGNPAPGVLGVAGNYRYGVNLYDNMMTGTFNAGAERVLSYANDVTLNGLNEITGGTTAAILKQNLSGTVWTSSFILSRFEAPTTAYVSALASVSSADDRTFLTSVLGGDDLISTSKFADFITSLAGDDTVRSGYGNDTVDGGDGIDYIDGGSDMDVINGGAGVDMVIGGRGNDTLQGGDGNDMLRGADGNDQLSGGTGEDVFLFRMGDDRDTITSFAQNVDKLDVSGMLTTTNWTKVQDGTSAVINVMGIEIVIQNTLIADMTNADFIF